MWPETQVAKNDSRCELVLTGADISRRIEADDGVFDPAVFRLSALNFLEVSKTQLRVLGDDLGLLTRMQNLVLRNNELETLPASIGNLTKLKLVLVSLDVAVYYCSSNILVV